MAQDRATEQASQLNTELSSHQQEEETIRQLAYYDGLTGVPSWTLFNDSLRVALAHAHRNWQRWP